MVGKNNAGTTIYSATVTNVPVTAPGAATQPVTVTLTPTAGLLPGAPTLATPTTPSSGTVGLSWAAPAAPVGLTGYNIYRATATGVSVAGDPLVSDQSATTYSDTSLTNGTAYFYKVAAVNSAGTGAASDEVTATPSASTTPVWGTATWGGTGVTWQ